MDRVGSMLSSLFEEFCQQRLVPRLTAVQHQALLQLEHARGIKTSQPPSMASLHTTGTMGSPPPPVLLGPKVTVVSAPSLLPIGPAMRHHQPSAIRPPQNNQVVQAPRNSSLLNDPNYRRVAQAFFLYPAKEVVHSQPKQNNASTR